MVNVAVAECVKHCLCLAVLVLSALTILLGVDPVHASHGSGQARK